MGNVVSNCVIRCSDRPPRGGCTSPPSSQHQHTNTVASSIFIPLRSLFFLSPILPPCQCSTEHAVPASLLSADGGEKEEGEGKTERERGGGRAVRLSCVSVTATPAFVTRKQQGRSSHNRPLKKKEGKPSATAAPTPPPPPDVHPQIRPRRFYVPQTQASARSPGQEELSQA